MGGRDNYGVSACRGIDHICTHLELKKTGFSVLELQVWKDEGNAVVLDLNQLLVWFIDLNMVRQTTLLQKWIQKHCACVQ